MFVSLVVGLFFDVVQTEFEVPDDIDVGLGVEDSADVRLPFWFFSFMAPCVSFLPPSLITFLNFSTSWTNRTKAPQKCSASGCGNPRGDDPCPAGTAVVEESIVYWKTWCPRYWENTLWSRGGLSKEVGPRRCVSECGSWRDVVCWEDESEVAGRAFMDFGETLISDKLHIDH